MSYSLALSSTMMSCTVHSPTDSLVQPTCVLVYIECNPAPGGSPFELSLGLRSNQSSPILPLLSEFLVWWFVLGPPWVTSCTNFNVSIVLRIIFFQPEECIKHNLPVYPECRVDPRLRKLTKSNESHGYQGCQELGWSWHQFAFNLGCNPLHIEFIRANIPLHCPL